MKPFMFKGLRKANGLLLGMLLTSFAITALAQVEVKVDAPVRPLASGDDLPN